MYHSQSQLVFVSISAKRFACFAFIADYIEQIIGNLERNADIQAKIGKRAILCFAASGQEAAKTTPRRHDGTEGES